MTRTAPRVISLKVLREGRTRQTSDRARATRKKYVNETRQMLPWTRLISFHWKKQQIKYFWEQLFR